MKRFVVAIAMMLVPGVAYAQDMKSYAFDGEFDDAAFGVENAIIGKRLVIDYVSHVGEMLARTKDDVGGSKDLFGQANVYLFCSAVLSRKMMEADAQNIAFCPYGVFVSEGEDGAVEVGYRTMPVGPMKEVEALLDSIAREVVEE